MKLEDFRKCEDASTFLSPQAQEILSTILDANVPAKKDKSGNTGRGPAWAFLFSCF